MSGGYHSRSPDEFREYVAKLNKPPRKKTWVQFIILADIVILLFLFLFYLNNLNKTGSKELLLKSNKVTKDNLNFHFSRGEDFKNGFSQYFLFVQNTGNLKTGDYLFPTPNTLIEFKLVANASLICGKVDITLHPKAIKPDSTEFFSFTMPKSLIEGAPEICRNIYGSLPSRGLGNFFNIFNNKENKISSILTIYNKKNSAKILELIIEEDLWLKD